MPFAMRILALLLIATAGMKPALALSVPGKFENLDRIDSLVAMTVGANLGQPGGPVAPVDRRLRLAACPQVPSVEGPVFGAAIVKCDTIGWRIRVPLIAGGQNATAPAPVSYGGGWAANAAPSRQAVVRKGGILRIHRISFPQTWMRWSIASQTRD